MQRGCEKNLHFTPFPYKLEEMSRPNYSSRYLDEAIQREFADRYTWNRLNTKIELSFMDFIAFALQSSTTYHSFIRSSVSDC